MRSLSAGLLTSIAAKTTTFCYLWKVTRQDAQVFGYTSNSRDVTYDSVIYEAATGLIPYALEASADLSVDNTEVEGVLTSDSITEEALMTGVWDLATVEVFMIDYNNVAAGAIPLSKGTIGNVRFRGGRFFAEVRGLTQHYQETIGDVYSPRCTAIFGDSRCKIDLSLYSTTGTVTGVTSRAAFLVSVVQFSSPSGQVTSGFYNLGKVTWLTGDNTGVTGEIRIGATGSPPSLAVTMQQPFFNDVQIGDTFQILPGCYRSAAVCITTYNNLVNFRGFPYVPGPPRLFGNNL